MADAVDLGFPTAVATRRNLPELLGMASPVETVRYP
jgi:hypothetical protein